MGGLFRMVPGAVDLSAAAEAGISEEMAATTAAGAAALTGVMPMAADADSARIRGCAERRRSYLPCHRGRACRPARRFGGCARPGLCHQLPPSKRSARACCYSWTSMPDPRWTGPPEQIALIFEAGTPASVLANNVVWVTETANKELSTGLSTVNALATATQWQGLGGIASMVGQHRPQRRIVQTLVGWTATRSPSRRPPSRPSRSPQSSVIPSVVSQTNRDEWAVLNATNFFGSEHPGDRRTGHRVLRRALAAQFEHRLDLLRCAERVGRGVGRSAAPRPDGCLAGRAGGGGRSGRRKRRRRAA